MLPNRPCIHGVIGSGAKGRCINVGDVLLMKEKLASFIKVKVLTRNGEDSGGRIHCCFDGRGASTPGQTVASLTLDSRHGFLHCNLYLHMQNESGVNIWVSYATKTMTYLRVVEHSC